MLPSRMFFDDMLSDFEKENKMKCDIFEKDNKVFIEMDVPGYDKKDIKLNAIKEILLLKQNIMKNMKIIKNIYIEKEKCLEDLKEVFI